MSAAGTALETGPRDQLPRLRTLAEEFESCLGDPALATNVLSFAHALEIDELEELPEEAIALIIRSGFHKYFVPATHGGQLKSCEQLLMLTRLLARRDMNVALSLSVQLWMMFMWIGGDAAQCKRVAPAVIRGEVIPCLAYTEADHGADLAANDFTAVPDGDHYLLSGRKWPINRAITSTHVVLMARTHPRDADDGVPEARTQSLFFIDKHQTPAGAIGELPRVPTHGLRGCDISGISFEGVRIPNSDRLGSEGAGLELALRGLLVTRTFCTGLSLGVGDTMLRVVSEFLANRTLYDGPASEIPYVSDSLANCYLSLLMAECASFAAMRGLNLYTAEFSTWGNLAKVGVARLIDHNSSVLPRTLGARFFMRDVEHQGMFQKMLRDGAIVSVFDGSEPVCLDSIALQLPSMAKQWRRPRSDDWRQLYDLRVELPDFDPARVTVFGRGRNAVFASLPALRTRLDALAPSLVCGPQQLTALRGLTAQLEQNIDDLFADVNEARQFRPKTPTSAQSRSAKTTPPQLMRLAERCCELNVKVTCLGIWLFNRDHLDAFFADGRWLEAALKRRHADRFDLGDLTPSTRSHLDNRLNTQREARKLFSILDVSQASRESPDESSHLVS